MAIADESEDEGYQIQVIGGDESEAGSYPWLGALVRSGVADLTRAQFCGCSLIDEYWILTAAHCLDGSPVGEVSVALGNGDLSGQNQVIPIDLIVLHPQYSETLDLQFDIALARLSRPADGIEPIELNHDPALVAAGAPTRVIGWGLTDRVQNNPSSPSRLREAELAVLDRSVVNAIDPLAGSVKASMIPVGEIDPLKTAYFGDSGGPMIVNANGRNSLAGITSWGTGCFIHIWPYSVYTDVIPYAEWIESVARSDEFSWRSFHGANPDLSDEDGDGISFRDEYRLSGDPTSSDSHTLIQEGGYARFEASARPFSREWEYGISQYDPELQAWEEIPWSFDMPINADGSVAFRSNLLRSGEPALFRVTQKRRSSPGPVLVDLDFNQTASGVIRQSQDFLQDGAHVFRFQSLSKGSHSLFIDTVSGNLRYELRFRNGSNWRQGPVGELSASTSFRELAVSAIEGDELHLLLSSVEGSAEYVTVLRPRLAEILPRVEMTGGWILDDTLAEFHRSGHRAIDLGFSSHLESATDIMVSAQGDFDAFIELFDKNDLSVAARANAFDGETREFLIFHVDGPLSEIGLRLGSGTPGASGFLSFQASAYVEPATLSLAEGFDFRALTLKDEDIGGFNGYPYVDRTILTGLGVGRRYLELRGLNSFRPFFALRNLTDGVTVAQFDRADCFESSVISFDAEAGKSYQAIVASGEWNLNKNFFLIISSEAPESPYDSASSRFGIQNLDMRGWLEKAASSAVDTRASSVR